MSDKTPESNPPGKRAQSDALKIVGIGASAGGLKAVESFLTGLPKTGRSEMAFVLVQHLDPNHNSLLTEILGRNTRLVVAEVTDGMAVAPGHLYIIPPAFDLELKAGHLHLLKPAMPHGHRLPIDSFFKSLASELEHRSIGVVLSGNGTDGTIGAKAIKAAGGLVIAQDPLSAEFRGMPESIINAHSADYVLAPDRIIGQLTLLIENGAITGTENVSAEIGYSEPLAHRLFKVLHEETGHDFSQYKPETVHRRIARQMAINQIKDLASYTNFLQQSPAAVVALFRDLLIGVTQFFRDPIVFEELRSEILPKILKDKSTQEALRVWSAGCSTGQEAYTLAIVIWESLQSLPLKPEVQIFATDIDSRAITLARSGVFPIAVANEMSQDVLAKHFTLEPEGHGYRIQKYIRDMIVFSEHDLIKDPPFSKLDMVVCRNLLIYFKPELQRKVMRIFHYALKSTGVLVLGNSEGVGADAELFSVVDPKMKLFKRTETSSSYSSSRGFSNGLFEGGPRLPPRTSGSLSRPPTQSQPTMREIAEQTLLQSTAPPSVLVNANGDVLYLHGRTGMYLEPASGEPKMNNVIKMAREGLSEPLLSALEKAVFSGARELKKNISVKTNGHFTLVDIEIFPVKSTAVEASGSSYYLVTFTDSQLRPYSQETTNELMNAPSETETEQLIQHLRQQILGKNEFLRRAHNEIETLQEELKSSSEEMQSINEEIQSSNEELETSKEELQSVNEELSTVNTELQVKVTDLSQANNDMNNLLAGIGIATIFVDQKLAVLRFTPAAKDIINLIPTDIGRPLSHLVTKLIGYSSLQEDMKQVLDTLVPKELELQSTDGRWFMMRIRPYRTLNNVIEGAVISFIDITTVVQTREALSKANDLRRLAIVVRDAIDAVTLQDLAGNILAWNPSAVRIYGWTEEEALSMNSNKRLPLNLRNEEILKLHQLSHADSFETLETKRLSKDGNVIEVTVVATPVTNAEGEIYGIATTERPRIGSSQKSRTK